MPNGLEDLASLFHKSDPEAAQRDASRAAEEVARSGHRTFRFANGTTRFLACPPYNHRGVLIKTIFNHNNLPICDDRVAGTPLFCPEGSDPESGVLCPVCAGVRLLHQVLPQIISRNPGVDVQARLTQATPRAQNNFNAIILSAVDPQGQPARDKKSGTVLSFPRLPFIVSCPSAVGNVVALAFGDYREGLYNPAGAIRFQVVRVGEKNDVRYTATMLPDREPLAHDSESIRAIATGLYDLDLELSLSKRWTKREYERSVVKIKALVASLNASLPPSHIPAWTDGADSGTASGDVVELGGAEASTSKPAMIFSGPDTSMGRTAEVLSSPPAQAPLDLSSSVQAHAPVPPATQLPVTQETITPDPDAIDPATGRPGCFGHQPTSIPAACKRCSMFDPCMMETTERSFGSSGVQ